MFEAKIGQETFLYMPADYTDVDMEVFTANFKLGSNNFTQDIAKILAIGNDTRLALIPLWKGLYNHLCLVWKNGIDLPDLDRRVSTGNVSNDFDKCYKTFPEHTLCRHCNSRFWTLCLEQLEPFPSDLKFPHCPNCNYPTGRIIIKFLDI